ncbi:MAG: zinc-binding dehydrogenase [Solirubrobacteraceae bacterium]
MFVGSAGITIYNALRHSGARPLGAHHYIDSTAGDPAQALLDLGGADVVLSTVTSAEALTAVFGGLRPRGRLMIVGASMEPIGVPPAALIGGSRRSTAMPRAPHATPRTPWTSVS